MRSAIRLKAPSGEEVGRTARFTAPSVVVLILVIANIVYRWVISRPGYFWQDDYYLMAWAEANPPNLTYLFLPFSDHFQPLGALLGWTAQRLFPGSYDAAMLWTAILYAGSIWTFSRLVRSIFGWRPQLTLVLVLWGFSVFTLQAFLWYAASWWLAPFLFFAPLALWAGVRYVRAPTIGNLAVAFVTALAAYLSHTFGFVVPIIMLLIIGTVPLLSPLGTGRPRDVLRWWRLLCVQAAPVLLLGFFYLTRASSGRAVTVAPLESFAFVWKELAWVIVPGLAGGPWRYNGYLSPEFPVFTPLGGFLLLEFVLLLGWLLKVHPRSGRLWLAMLAVASLQIVVVTLGRGGEDTALVVRYAAPTLLPLAIAVSAMLAWPVHAPSPWRASGRRLAEWWRNLSAPTRVVVTAGLLQAFLISFSITVQVPAFDTPFAANRAYMERLISSVERLGSGTVLLPQFVPNSVVGVNAPGPTSTQLVLASQRTPPEFANQVVGDLVGVNDRGEVVPEIVMGVSGLPGPDGECGTFVAESAVIPLERQAEYWFATISLGVLSDRDAAIKVELLSGGIAAGLADITVPRGLNRVYAPLPGSGDAVRVTVQSGYPLCVTDLTVGERFHDNDGSWKQDGSSLPVQSFDLSP